MSESIQAKGHKTKAGDKVPVFEKISYGIGLASDHFATVSIMGFLMAFFTDFLNAGIKASIVGAAIAVARLWDAFTDPAAGRISDGCRAKWGRRRPFIFFGSLSMGLFFPVIWMVPQTWSAFAINTWLFITVLVFYTLYSIFSVPYEALGAELTPDYRERTSIFVVRTYVQQVYTLFLYWMMPIAMALATLPHVAGEVEGVRMVSWFIGGVIIVAGIFPSFFCKERYKKIAEKEDHLSFGETCKALLGNKPLLIVIGTICFYLFSIMLSMNLAYFVNTYYVFEGDTLQGTTLSAIDGTFRIFIAIGAAFAIKQLADRIDKHKLLIGCIIILIVGFAGTYFTTLPGRPWLTLVFKPFISIGEVGFWVLVMSLRADVCDWDEFKTGTRNEGMIAAITNWVNKIAITLALALGGVMLEHVIKFDSNIDKPARAAIEQQAEMEWNALPEEEKRVEEDKVYENTWAIVKDIGGQILKFGAQEEVPGVTFEDYKKNLEQKEIMKRNDSGVMQRLRALYTLPQVVALVICFFILIRYPLNSKKMAEIREELEARRGVAK
ncbi:MFS transporter [Pontiella agarivorans]|uniref:MFS transporter n=1 Tax=Pontiella agarivorans TaxID=3038953 RepID=A0ABU5MTV4_9BACT|nr:MFS transporter [Pontiella agarivorans]MDZ8117526.1 MFS transporter [Pontiella agarivorans]